MGSKGSASEESLIKKHQIHQKLRTYSSTHATLISILIIRAHCTIHRSRSFGELFASFEPSKRSSCPIRAKEPGHYIDQEEDSANRQVSTVLMESAEEVKSSSISPSSTLSIKLLWNDLPAVMGEASPTASNHKMRIMIVGDSITHGVEGDHTWRYRLWEWLQGSTHSTTFEFVGPYSGTVPPEKPHPPEPPRFAGEPEPPERDLSTGGYALDVSKDFSGRHFAYTGRQVFQAKDTIEEQVSLHQPDLLLVMLGFNDLGWCVSGPEGTLENMMKFISNARAAKGDLRFAVANVLQRSPLPGHPELTNWTTKYNSMLQDAIDEDHRQSGKPKIELVDIEQHYGDAPDHCKGTCDGLHPNALGEYQIAHAFSLTLHRAFGYGNAALKIPHHIPPRPIHVPRNVRALGVPYGIRFTFDAVYGARGYDVRHRVGGAQGQWSEGYQGSNQFDNSFTGAGVLWEFQVRTKGGEDEKDKSEWSEVVSALARQDNAPAPRSIGVYATSTGFEAAWEPLGAGWEVERYAVLWQDKTVGGFLCAQGARSNSTRVERLDPGHRYEVWLQTWTRVGPGVPESVAVLVVGSGVFSRPGSRNK